MSANENDVRQRVIVDSGPAVAGMSDIIKIFTQTAQATGKLQEKITLLSMEQEKLAERSARLTEVYEQARESIRGGTSDEAKYLEAQRLTTAAKEKQAEVDKDLEKVNKKLGEAQTVLAVRTQGSTDSFTQLGQVITNFVQAPLQTMHTGLMNVLTRLGPTAVGIGAVAGAAIAAGSAVFAFGKRLGDMAQAITNQSRITGMDVVQIQALNLESRKLGVSGEAVVRAISLIQGQLGKAGETTGIFEKKMKELGISMKDAQGHTRPLIDVFSDFQLHLRGIADEEGRARAVTGALGMRGRLLAPMLLDLNKTMKENIEIMANSGAVMDKEMVQRAVEMHHKLFELGLIWDKIKVKLGSPIIGAISLVITGSDISDAELGRLGQERAAVLQERIKKTEAQLQALGEPKAVTEGGVTKMIFPAGYTEVQTHLVDLQKELKKLGVVALDTGKKLVDPEVLAAQLAQANLIKEGLTDNIGLRLALAKATREFNEAVQAEEGQEAIRIAGTIAGLAKELEARHKIWLQEQAVVQLRERAAKLQAKGFEFMPYGVPELPLPKMPESVIQPKFAIKETQKQAVEYLKLEEKIREDMDRRTLEAGQRNFQLEQQIISLKTPMWEQDAVTVAITKANLEYQLNMEELRTRFAQARLKYEIEIKKLEDPAARAYLENELKVLDELQSKQAALFQRLHDAEVIKAQQDEYIRVVGNIREAAGHIFDDTYSQGKNVFQSLADAVKNIFMSAFRTIFQNIVQLLFTGGASARGQGGILGALLQGVIPQGGAGGGGGPLGGFMNIFSRIFSGGGAAKAATATMSTMGGAMAIGGAGPGGLPTMADLAGQSLSKLGQASGEAAAGMSKVGTSAGSAAGHIGKLGTGASMAAAAMVMGGSMLMMHGIQYGKKAESAAGGAIAGAGIGMSFGPVGAAVGAGIGALVGLVGSLFGGGAARREALAKMRAETQAKYQFAMPAAENLTVGTGMTGVSNIETNFMGQLQALPQVKSKNVVMAAGSVVIKLMDASDVERHTAAITKAIRKAVATGILGDDIAFAAD